MKFLKRLFLSFSSFFPGLILFIFTINICPNVENLLASITKIIILIIVMLVVAFVTLNNFEKKKNLIRLTSSQFNQLSMKLFQRI